MDNHPATTCPPLIIIGMHRSGTSMITDMLESLGLFMGFGKNAMQEARFFLKINRWILRESGGSWIQPETVNALLDNPQARTYVDDYLRFLLSTPRVINYLGWQQFLRWRTPSRLNLPWGWKDPQNTYTLPFWLDIFPEAKVIHIYRNGVDAANSLWVRSQANLIKLTKWRTSRWRYSIRENSHPHSESCYITLQEGFDLWERYTCEADKQVASLPADRGRVICYETFLQNPMPVFGDLCDFLGLRADQKQIIAASEKINPHRGYAFKQDENLLAFYNQVRQSSQMIKYGYDKLV